MLIMPAVPGLSNRRLLTWLNGFVFSWAEVRLLERKYSVPIDRAKCGLPTRLLVAFRNSRKSSFRQLTSISTASVGALTIIKGGRLFLTVEVLMEWFHVLR